MHIAHEEGGPYDDSNEGVELMSRPYTALDDQANNFEDNPPTRAFDDGVEFIYAGDEVIPDPGTDPDPSFSFTFDEETGH